MSTRISKLVLLASLGLAGCDRKTESAAPIRPGEEARAAEQGRIPCALDGGRDFTSVCTIDRERSGDGLILTVRHPDGGFHRLKVATDGRGVVAADGAAETKVTVIDKTAIEVAIDDARYRLPATIRTPGK